MRKLDISTVSSIMSIPCRRTELSQIRKALPSRIVGVIDNPNTYTNADCIFYFPLNNIIKEITDNKCTICGEPETMMHQLFFCNNAKHLWDIGRKILGTGELSLVEQDSSTVANLKEVSPSIINEIIKSVIFKLLIQIDRSSNLNELDTRRTIAHWMSIEYQALSKTFKNNKLQLAYLQSILSKLRG